MDRCNDMIAQSSRGRWVIDPAVGGSAHGIDGLDGLSEPLSLFLRDLSEDLREIRVVVFGRQ